MVKVYIDIVSGDEMISDGYPNKEVFNGAGLEVQGRMVTKGEEDVGVAVNVGEDEEVKEEGGIPKGETVIDIVDRFNLQETSHDKKSFQAYVKVYLNRIKKELEARGKKSRIPEFQKGAVELVKKILSDIESYQFFTGPSMDFEGALAVCTYPEGSTEPVFYFFLDGLEGKEY